jgi:hypothetical protein
MGSLLFLFYPWGLILQVLAVLHFIRRRPDTYWLWIILIGGGLGALAYLLIEAAPDYVLIGQVFQGFSRRSRISQLETMVLDNPSAGNYEELGILYLDEKKFARARQCFDKAISSRTDHADPFYRRAICELETRDFPAASADLQKVMKFDSKYDYGRAAGLMAHAYANTGETEKADRLFRDVLERSTLSETQYNYAAFLSSQGRANEAREWLQSVLNKKRTLPHYLKRKERPWFRKAGALLKQLPRTDAAARA